MFSICKSSFSFLMSYGGTRQSSGCSPFASLRENAAVGRELLTPRSARAKNQAVKMDSPYGRLLTARHATKGRSRNEK